MNTKTVNRQIKTGTRRFAIQWAWWCLWILCVIVVTEASAMANTGKGVFPFRLKFMVQDEQAVPNDSDMTYAGIDAEQIFRGRMMPGGSPIVNDGWVVYRLNETRFAGDNLEFEFKIHDEWAGNGFGRYQRLADDSFTITMMALGAIGVLYMSPNNVSNWEDKDLSPVAMGDRYAHKVGNGPVVDKDEDGINFVGHPYFGGAYYMHARTLGYPRNDAFLFSFLMSTCMYEYGVEAFFERPSMQDLVFTPIAGSFVGELMWWGQTRIRANQMRVAGSQVLGYVCTVLLDPIGFAVQQIDRMTSIFPNTHVNTRFFAYQHRTSDGGDYPGGFGGNRDFRCGVEIQWYQN